MNLQDMIQKRNDLEEYLDVKYDAIIDELNNQIRNHPDYKTTREYEQDQDAENNGHIW